jgi:hypothetical protein
LFHLVSFCFDSLHFVSFGSKSFQFVSFLFQFVSFSFHFVSSTWRCGDGRRLARWRPAGGGTPFHLVYDIEPILRQGAIFTHKAIFRSRGHGV